MPDLVAWVETQGSLQPSYCALQEPSLLVVELKRPSLSIGAEHMEQAFYYAYALRHMAGERLLGVPIECLVIGGGVDHGLTDYHFRENSAAHDGIRVTPMSYERLVVRAESVLLLDLASRLGQARLGVSALAVPALSEA
jgi:hypothetical protein